MFNNSVLNFYGYFTEKIPESRIEKIMIRKVNILFYLEDGSIQINEKKIKNSGLKQGCFLKR